MVCSPSQLPSTTVDLIVVALEDQEMWSQERCQPWHRAATKWAQVSTVQYSTVQYSTVQHSTGEDKVSTHLGAAVGEDVAIEDLGHQLAVLLVHEEQRTPLRLHTC